MSLDAIVLILATVALICIHTARLMYLKRWNAFDPLNAFWGGVIAVYVVQPLSYGSLYDSWHAQGVLERTCFWVVFAMCFVIAGYESRFGRLLTNKIPTMPARLHPLQMQWCAYAAILIGLMGYYYQVSSAGGFSEWAAVGRGGTDWKNVSSSLAQFADLLPFGITILLFECELHYRTTAKRLFAWSLGGGMWLWLFYLGTRSRTIAFAGVLLAAYYIPRRRNPPLAVLAACALFLFVSSEFLGQYRYQFTDLSFNIHSEDIQGIQENVLPQWLGGRKDAQKNSTSEGAEFNCVMAVVEVVPDVVPFDRGYALLEILTRPIPHVLWPEKRYPHYESFTKIHEAAGIPGFHFETDYASLIAGPAFTFVGHWYRIGGPFALAFMGFLTGAFFRAIRGLYDRGCGEADAILYMLMAPIGFGEAAATPLFFLFSLPYVLVPALLMFRICQSTATRPSK